MYAEGGGGGTEEGKQKMLMLLQVIYFVMKPTLCGVTTIEQKDIM